MSPAAPRHPDADARRRPVEQPHEGVHRFLLALVTPVVLLAGLAACSKNNTNPSDLPDGATLLTQAATASNSISSTHIIIDVDQDATHLITTLPVKRVEGDLLRTGDAKGSIQLISGAQLIGLDFVVSGDKLYLKYPTGGWQDGGAIKTIYDPSSILDPNRGIVKLLGGLTSAHTEGTEKIAGTDTYRVAIAVTRQNVSILLPLVDSIPTDLTGKVWIDKQTNRLTKISVDTPANGGAPAGSITAAFSNYDQPVTVNVPTS
ncbi:MAG TPA: LppX_LprAFG lipoprotein [Micromonosporaceae bacterium]|jgi:lipoprotein LprG